MCPRSLSSFSSSLSVDSLVESLFFSRALFSLQYISFFSCYLHLYNIINRHREGSKKIIIILSLSPCGKEELCLSVGLLYNPIRSVDRLRYRMVTPKTKAFEPQFLFYFYFCRLHELNKLWYTFYRQCLTTDLEWQIQCTIRLTYNFGKQSFVEQKQNALIRWVIVKSIVHSHFAFSFLFLFCLVALQLQRS